LIANCQLKKRLQSKIKNRKSKISPRFVFCRIACASRQTTSIAFAQLPTRAALQSFFVRAVTDASVEGQYSFDFGVWPWDHVYADQLAYAAGRSGASVCCSFHRTDITAHKYRDVTGADIFFAQELDVGGFHHGVSGLNGPDEALGLDHS
jgi:hypothetical protein